MIPWGLTEFTGNIVSVNTSGNTFVMQGPYGFQETIDVNGSTLYNGSNALSSLMANGTVSSRARYRLMAAFWPAASS